LQQRAEWELLATLTGGSVTWLTIADGLVFAATPAGIRCSGDGGRTWMDPGADSAVPFATVVSAAPHFAAHRTLYAASREGVFRSTDAGQHWMQVLSGGTVAALAVISADTLLAGTEADGVLRSDDGGRSWTSASPGLLDLTVLALALSPDFDTDHIGFVATSSGVYRTRNGCHSWRAADLGLDDLAVQCLAVSPAFARDGLVFAGTETAGLLRSDDGGETWTPVPIESRNITAVAFSPRYSRRSTLVAASDAGLSVSHDAGATWKSVGGELGPVLALTVFDDSDGDVVLAGLVRNGVARSTYSGEHWHPSSDGLAARLLVSLNCAPDGAVFAADLQGGVARSDDGGLTWIDDPFELAEVPVYALTCSRAYDVDRTLFAATAVGLRRSVDDGATWLPLPGARLGETRAIAAAGTTVLAGLLDGKVTCSDDNGQTWRLLRGFDDAEIISLAVSPDEVRDRTLCVVTVSGAELVVWRSEDAGQRWIRWFVNRAAGVAPIAVPPGSLHDGAMFLGVQSSVWHPLKGTQEVRGGERRPLWRRIDLADAEVNVTALALSPNYAVDGTLFVGTNRGVFVSRDRGEQFEAWSDGLHPRSVVALACSADGAVYALGPGGNIWRGGRADAPGAYRDISSVSRV
jgi:photosystem II stability/assembly factor-like uncharacterized protein